MERRGGDIQYAWWIQLAAAVVKTSGGLIR